ncbi:MAG: hypothetical protein OXP69_14990, partial [Spirochaetaceae bacterium]|nr:hypothetical protein [Spirochaetaceae bacterium]
MATKDDLAAMEQRMATKDELAAMEQRMATKDDLAAMEQRMATKDELAAMEQRIEVSLAEMVREGADRILAAVTELAETKADKEHVHV